MSIPPEKGLFLGEFRITAESDFKCTFGELKDDIDKLVAKENSLFVYDDNKDKIMFT